MKEISIITGGNSGLGLALAEVMVSKGFNMAIIGRNIEKVEKAVNILMERNGNVTVIGFPGDITDESFVHETYDSLVAEGWIIKKLFNCAGIGRFGKPENNTREMIDVNLGASVIGTILMSTSALKVMKETGGTIVNIMSSAAFKGSPNESVYCASKWAARGYTEALRTYLKGSSIKVVGVYPSGMNTPFWSPNCGESPDTSKLMNPAEVAEEILYAVQGRLSMYVSDIVINKL